jgi:integrase/recombinase XerD
VSVVRQVERYLLAKRAMGYSELTLNNRRSHLTRFARYLEGIGITEISALTRESIEAYMEELSWAPVRVGKLMTPATRNVRLTSIRSFCAWLLESDVVPLNPAIDVVYCREPNALPKNVPSEEEMKRLLAAPDAQSRLGFRDRVVLELLYSTGLRLRELCGLDVDELELEQGFVLVRRGKGDKARVVPLGRLAVDLVRSYLSEIRPWLRQGCADPANEPALVLSRYGQRLGPRGVAKIIARIAKKAGLAGRITPHSFRHACATHMLRGGANIRHLQELLGHAKLTSTEIYTRVSISELKEVHARFHPRGTLEEPDVRKPGRGKR